MSLSGSSQFANSFGSVHSDRIAFFAKKGWFSGGVQEDIPIRHVTSVRLEITRRPILAIILIVGGLALFPQSGGGMVFGLILIALSILMLIGWPKVTVNTAGNDLRTSSGGVWQKGEAEAFVTAVKKVLFDRP
jgi:hypothetical protein